MKEDFKDMFAIADILCGGKPLKENSIDEISERLYSVQMSKLLNGEEIKMLHKLIIKELQNV